MMDRFIHRTLLALLSCSALAIVFTSPCRSSSHPPQPSPSDLPADEPHSTPPQTKLLARRKLKATYLVVYALVMFADWLQGSYIFSLYHEQYGLSLHLVSLLFVLGFATAAVAAFGVGRWADVYGRKRMCLVFVVSYTLSCVVKFSPFLPTLFLGRLLGGLATAILFSAFESYLVAAAHSPEVAMPPAELGRLLGRLTLVSSVAAVGSGFVADAVVGATGSFASPFGVSAGCLVGAGVVIVVSWGENYGVEGVPGGGEEGRASLRAALVVLRKDPLLLMLTVVNTVVETTMYLWVALWVPSLQDTLSEGDAPLPLGRVFSSFMAAMSLGSLVYNAVLYRYGPNTKPKATDVQPAPADEHQSLLARTTPLAGAATGPVSQAVVFHARLGSGLLVLSGVANVLSAFTGSTRTRFLCFLVFEGSLGLYYPVVANLRAALIPDSSRATLTALFRVPFNVLVTLALVLGLEAYRTEFLVGSGVALVGAAGVAAGLARRAGRQGSKVAVA